MDTSKRLSTLRSKMQAKNIDFCLVMEPDNQYYLSDFKAITYSRPIFTLIDHGRTELIIPALEEYHAAEEARIDHIHIYYEDYARPGKQVSWLKMLDLVLDRFQGKIIGIEMDIMPASLSRHLEARGLEIKDIGLDIIEMRYIKDADEIELLDEAGRLSDIALEASLKSAGPGISELELDAAGDRVLLEEAARRHPNCYIGYENWTCSGIERTAMPHLYSNTRTIEKGDMVIHSRQVWFQDYRAENERTFFVGKPSSKQLDLFKLAVEAQRAGLETIRPGIPAGAVDLAARKVIDAAGFQDYAVHRIGHGLGLSEHEEPYLRFDNELILQEGMVFSIEPGIYVPGIGGFRHSDTVIITANGARTITNSPREVEDLIFD